MKTWIFLVMLFLIGVAIAHSQNINPITAKSDSLVIQNVVDKKIKEFEEKNKSIQDSYISLSGMKLSYIGTIITAFSILITVLFVCLGFTHYYNTARYEKEIEDLINKFKNEREKFTKESESLINTYNDDFYSTKKSLTSKIIELTDNTEKTLLDIQYNINILKNREKHDETFETLIGIIFNSKIINESEYSMLQIVYDFAKLYSVNDRVRIDAMNRLRANGSEINKLNLLLVKNALWVIIKNPNENDQIKTVAQKVIEAIK